MHTQVSGVKGGIHYTDIFPDVMTDDFFSYICSKKIKDSLSKAALMCTHNLNFEIK